MRAPRKRGQELMAICRNDRNGRHPWAAPITSGGGIDQILISCSQNVVRRTPGMTKQSVVIVTMLVALIGYSLAASGQGTVNFVPMSQSVFNSYMNHTAAETVAWTVAIDILHGNVWLTNGSTVKFYQSYMDSARKTSANILLTDGTLSISSQIVDGDGPGYSGNTSCSSLSPVSGIAFGILNPLQSSGENQCVSNLFIGQSYVSSVASTANSTFAGSLGTFDSTSSSFSATFDIYTTYGTSSKMYVFGLTPTSSSAPNIATQPQSQTAPATSNVAFAVVANSTPLPNYQWRFNGQDIAGQTAASMSLTNIQFTTAGGYSVVVANAYGSVTSAVAYLTVFTNLVLIQTNRTPKNTEIGNPTIPTDNHLKMFTNGAFQGGIALNPNKTTVVITHGWNGNPSDWAEYTAQIIQRRIGSNAVNLVAWDWSAEAQSLWYGLGTIAARTPGEGTALGTALVTALGTPYSQRIHFIGHSLGTLVNATAADYIHASGFAWTNTQMTLCDEAEVAWEFTSTGWQTATTIPQIIGQAHSTLLTLSGNFSTPQPYWRHPLPKQFAWADNYVSAFGLLHPEAANTILSYTYPSSSADIDTVVQEFHNFHAYAHYFYEDTIEPGIFNTGSQTNATFGGFLSSFEGGGFDGRPATNTFFSQDPTGLELNLVQTSLASATNVLNARFDNYLNIGASSVASQEENWALSGIGQALGQVTGRIESTAGMIVNLFTGGGSGILQSEYPDVPPRKGPVPNDSGSNNTPAYVWIPLAIPTNTVSMSFDFLLQGNGSQDSFQVALQGTNILSLETSLIQTNVTLNSGVINVAQYAGQQVELFVGIVGGTSTNAAVTASAFQFYSVLPPSLQIQLSGINVVLAWPLSAGSYALESTDTVKAPHSWTTVTNVPAIVNFEYSITNPITADARFYRLHSQ